MAWKVWSLWPSLLALVGAFPHQCSNSTVFRLSWLQPSPPWNNRGSHPNVASSCTTIAGWGNKALANAAHHCLFQYNSQKLDIQQERRGGILILKEKPLNFGELPHLLLIHNGISPSAGLFSWIKKKSKWAMDCPGTPLSVNPLATPTPSPPCRVSGHPGVKFDTDLL